MLDKTQDEIAITLFRVVIERWLLRYLCATTITHVLPYDISDPGSGSNDEDMHMALT